MKTHVIFTMLFLVGHLAFGQWTQQGPDINGEAINDWAGTSVSLSADGTIVVIGAQNNDGNGNNSGHVRVYEWDGMSWTQRGADLDGEAVNDQSGTSVSLSADGSILAIGAQNNDGNGNNSGHVRVYEWDGMNWNQRGTDIDGEAVGDFSGQSVSLSADGSSVAIGARNNDGNGSASGHVRVYEWDGMNWNQRGTDIDGEAIGDQSGYSVSLSADGSSVAIGAVYNDANGIESGHVRVYQYQDSNWVQQGADIDGEAAIDFSGWSVSLSADGGVVAIGAMGSDSNGTNSGHVRVYQWDGMNWNQRGADINGEAAYNSSGWSVSLSNDGSVVAVGARNNDGNGSSSGHVRVYQWDGMSWNQSSADINGEAAYDGSGYAVSLGADGSSIAIGAPYNDGNGTNSGHVRVYRNPVISDPYIVIPDPNFEQALIDQGIDSEGTLDGQVPTGDISGLTTLNVANSNIADLTGIGAFEALETLYCEWNTLSSLNVVQNANVTFLSCYNNQLTALDVTQNSSLTALHCQNNQLEGSLTVDGATSLTDFNATGNPALLCIRVANANDANTGSGIYGGWVKDDTASYAENCIVGSEGNIWIQQGSDLNGEAAIDFSGWSVSLSANGGVVAIGAPFNDGNSSNSGHVRVYEWDGLIWNQLGQDLDGEASGDNSGRSVSLSADGTIVAIGAIGNDGNGSSSGHVRIYEWDGMSWNQLGADIDGEADGDTSGWSVSLSADGTIVAIGATGNDENGSNSGHVRVYQWDGINWNQLGSDIDGEAIGDQSGYSVSLSADGNTIAIGARYNDGNGSNAGHVRVYQWDGINWNQLGSDIDGEAIGDQSGYSVSLNADGTIVAIGARNNDGNGSSSGHVRVYQWDGMIWNQVGQDLDGEAAGDTSGWSVSLSADGTIVAIGATGNDGNGSSSGHVRVYQWDGMMWNQRGADIDGEAAGDFSGISVSLNADGSVVAIGAIYNDENGFDPGHARVYRYLSAMGSPYTAIPDTNFEQALIDQGIDSEGTLDGQALTDDLTGVTTLNVANSNIANLTGIEAFAALDTLYCEFNLLPTLNVTQNPNLTFLSCYNNQLTGLDVTQNPGLTALWTATNQLTQLDVSQNPNLTDLRCFLNQLTALDLSQNTALTELWCYDNQITALDFSQNPNLQYVYARFNALETIDVSQNPDLTVLACHENQLTALDVSQNPNLTELYSYANPLLPCITVANATDADAGVGIYAGWIKDAAALYSEDCGMMARSTGVTETKNTKVAAVPEEALFTTDEFILHPNPVHDLLHITVPDENALATVTLYTLQGQQVVQTKSNSVVTAQLPAGLYLAVLEFKDGTRITKKVVVANK